MKDKHTGIIKVLPLAFLVALGAVSCATGPEGEAEGNGSALTGRGHGGRGHGAFAEERMAELTRDLGLSEEQAARVRAIHDEAMAEGGGGRFEMRERIHARISQLLTPEQRERFDARPVERRLGHLTERLGLDARQVEQVRTILQESRTQMEQQLQGTERGPERREAMMTLHEQARERIAGVLTAEQRETFEDMPSGPGFGHGAGGPGGHHRMGMGGGAGGCGGGEGCLGSCGGDCGGEGCPGACGGNCGGRGQSSATPL